MTPTPSALDRAKNELARILNVDADAVGRTDGGIKTGNPKWLALMREGVVIKLHIRRRGIYLEENGISGGKL